MTKLSQQTELLEAPDSSSSGIGDVSQDVLQDVLKDPAVQQQILKAMQEKHPEVIGMAKDRLAKRVENVNVAECASSTVAMVCGAPEKVVGLIEQGETGVRFLAFCISCFSLVWAAFTFLNPFEVVQPVNWLLAVYQGIFSITTMLFEAKPEWIEAIPGLNMYQNALLENARFLALCRGRGMFYVFQGTLWLAEVTWTAWITAILGLLYCFIGGIHISMHYGVMPEHIAVKLRRGASKAKSGVKNMVFSGREGGEQETEGSTTAASGSSANIGVDAATASKDGKDLEMPERSSSAA